jgi:hypothetical protein
MSSLKAVSLLNQFCQFQRIRIHVIHFRPELDSNSIHLDISIQHLGALQRNPEYGLMLSRKCRVRANSRLKNFVKGSERGFML